jgi:uncharacterized PurR-regulated membrane protein YhhQ (DUF165 family)
MNISLSQKIAQIKQLLIQPKEFWLETGKKQYGTKQLLLSYIIPLATVGAVAVFVGEFFKRTDFFIEYPALKALREMVLFISQYFIGVFFTTELMKTFGASKNRKAAQKLVAFSMVPLLLVSVLTGLFPFLYVLDIAALFGFYLFWVGARELLTLDESKEHSYIILTIVVNFLVFSFLSVLLSQLLNAYY